MLRHLLDAPDLVERNRQQLAAGRKQPSVRLVPKVGIAVPWARRRFRHRRASAFEWPSVCLRR